MDGVVAIEDQTPDPFEAPDDWARWDREIDDSFEHGEDLRLEAMEE